jgi:hypothetical protein
MLNSHGSIPRNGKRFFCISQHPGRLWDPTNLLLKRYQELFPRDKSNWGVKMATNLHLVGNSITKKEAELYLHFPIYPYSVALK